MFKVDVFRIGFLLSLIVLSTEIGIGGQTSAASNIPIINFTQFEPLLHKQNDTVYLINFWATWCAPCREEIPAIQKIEEKYSNQKLKILLISLDFPNQIESRLIPFIREHNLKSQVIVLDDPNQNSWIDKVDTNWSGGLPFTLIYGKNFRESYSHSFHYQQLDSIINLNFKKL